MKTIEKIFMKVLGTTIEESDEKNAEKAWGLVINKLNNK